MACRTGQPFLDPTGPELFPQGSLGKARHITGKRIADDGLSKLVPSLWFTPFTSTNDKRAQPAWANDHENAKA